MVAVTQERKCFWKRTCLGCSAAKLWLSQWRERCVFRPHAMGLHWTTNPRGSVPNNHAKSSGPCYQCDLHLLLAQMWWGTCCEESYMKEVVFPRLCLEVRFCYHQSCHLHICTKMQELYNCVFTSAQNACKIGLGGSSFWGWLTWPCLFQSLG